MAFRILAGVMFAVAVLMGFGWLVDQDTGRAVGLVAAGLLSLVLSTVPVGPVAQAEGIAQGARVNAGRMAEAVSPLSETAA